MIDDEENSLNVRCFAAPVFNARGETIAAPGTSTTILQFDEACPPKGVEFVKDAARKVSRRFDFSGVR